jgi:hypothetical protein
LLEAIQKVDGVGSAFIEVGTSFKYVKALIMIETTKENDFKQHKISI